jgi:hypothetical protein
MIAGDSNDRSIRFSRGQTHSREHQEAKPMRPRQFANCGFFLAFALACIPAANAGSLSASHSSSAIPGAPGPAITLLSITGTNDGTNLTFTLTFANPTIEGPSSGNADAVYGFINLDTDKNPGTGVTGLFLDSNQYESAFGHYTPSSLGVDAYVNLTSEGDPLHGAPGLVDVVTTGGATPFSPIDTVAVTYSNQVGATPSTLTLTIPLVDFSKNQIPLLDTGNFAAVVGNVNNATDFLVASSTTVPEPRSWTLLSAGLMLVLLATAWLRGRV